MELPTYFLESGKDFFQSRRGNGIMRNKLLQTWQPNHAYLNIPNFTSHHKYPQNVLIVGNLTGARQRSKLQFQPNRRQLTHQKGSQLELNPSVSSAAKKTMNSNLCGSTPWSSITNYFWQLKTSSRENQHPKWRRWDHRDIIRNL